MRKTILPFLVLLPCFAFGQFGLKAGLNFANVTKVSSIDNSSQSGFHGGIIISPASKGVMGYRTEVLFSRQGYNFKTSTNTGNVNLDYILLPQLMAFNITKVFQIQVGGQMAFLINATADSSNNTGGNNNPYGKLMDYYNKFDFGLGGGVEVHPFKGLLVGARFNISLTNLYNIPESGQVPSFIPTVDVKNNLFQLFAGWRFGK
jgi:Outer membrane protein beta-barrel domain